MDLCDFPPHQDFVACEMERLHILPQGQREIRITENGTWILSRDEDGCYYVHVKGERTRIKEIDCRPRTQEICYGEYCWTATRKDK